MTNRWIDVNIARELAKKAGWGRIHVMRIPPERASYLAKYLSKKRPQCFKGWRLWAGFGEWDWTKVKDVVFDSLFCRIYRACKEAFAKSVMSQAACQVSCFCSTGRAERQYSLGDYAGNSG